jgi:hypothetical protein
MDWGHLYTIVAWLSMEDMLNLRNVSKMSTTTVRISEVFRGRLVSAIDKNHCLERNSGRRLLDICNSFGAVIDGDIILNVLFGIKSSNITITLIVPPHSDHSALYTFILQCSSLRPKDKRKIYSRTSRGLVINTLSGYSRSSLYLRHRSSHVCKWKTMKDISATSRHMASTDRKCHTQTTYRVKNISIVFIQYKV